MGELEEKLESAFTGLDVSAENVESIKRYLGLLKQKDQNTYEHSIRVGLLGMHIAYQICLDPKALFFAGVLHDVGKTAIDPEIVRKKEGFDEDDMRAMRKHSKYTYELLRGIHDFSAEVCIRHHRYQHGGYPKRLPKPRIAFSESTKCTIDFYARLLSLADFYDAVTTRENNKFGRKPTEEEAKEILLNNNIDLRYLILKMYDRGIFGTQEANIKKI
jgi:putative nucleotidyltransferase with HDIG domain